MNAVVEQEQPQDLRLLCEKYREFMTLLAQRRGHPLPELERFEFKEFVQRWTTLDLDAQRQWAHNLTVGYDKTVQEVGEQVEKYRHAP